MISPWLFLCGAALAGPADVFGLGARGAGRGGGSVADPDGADAAFLNPAALPGMARGEIAVGFGFVRADFDDLPPVQWDTNRDGLLDDNDEPLSLDPDPMPADGISLLWGRPLLDGRVGVGLAAWLPKDRLLTIGSTEPALPYYPMFAQRLNRFDLQVGLGVQPVRGVRVGAGAQVIAAATVDIRATIDLAVQGAEEGDEEVADLVGDVTADVHTISLDVTPVVVPVLALQWDVGELVPALDGLAFGATWRGSGGLPVDIDLDLQANAAIEDMGELEPIVMGIVIPAQMAFLDHYIPPRLQVGAAYRFRDLVGASVDVDQTSWEAFQPSVTSVLAASLQSPLVDLSDQAIADGNTYSLELRTTTAVRVGVDGTPLRLQTGGRLGEVALTARGGWGYQPSPIVAQGRGTAFLDSDRMVWAAGLGVEHGDPLALVAGPVRWDLFFQRQVLASGQLELAPDDQDRPGSTVAGAPIPIGGQLTTAGLQWSFAY